jgi:hypothetical protein
MLGPGPHWPLVLLGGISLGPWGCWRGKMKLAGVFYSATFSVVMESLVASHVNAGGRSCCHWWEVMLSLVGLMLSLVGLMLSLVELMLSLVELMLSMVGLMLSLVELMLSLVELMLSLVELMLSMVELMLSMETEIANVNQATNQPTNQLTKKLSN